MKSTDEPENSMWLDSETDVDFVNFGSVAESVAELIVQAGGKPLSIGVSGPWGVGKSSLIKQTRVALQQRDTGVAGDKANPPKYVFVEFNAWLYQGYDDARAALMETIAEKLAEIASERETGVAKTQEFLRRIDWFRLAGLAAGSAVAVAMGLPPVGLLGQAFALIKRGQKSGVDSDLIQDATDTAGEAIEQGKSLIKDREGDDESPRQKIQGLRDSFVAALKELDITLVVLIDDLDRCLPETAVSTLEAIRLFLFLDGTAFVIAADDQMIKHAVKRHFEQPDDALVTNYFDKLIQVPIRVPTLGTQEVRAYMFLLYVENSTLEEADRELIRVKVCERLANSWQGLRLDRQFVQSLEVDLPPDLVAQLDTADRLTTIMATSPEIAGNPRLIKRFLNALSVRMAVAKGQGITIDEAVLAKLLLFERLAPPVLYAELATVITNSPDGKPHFIADWEGPTDEDISTTDPANVKGDDNDGGKATKMATKTDDGQTHQTTKDAAPPRPDNWNTPFVTNWLSLPPRLADIDMRGALYVSREHLPIILRDDGLSSAGTELLQALIAHPSEANALAESLAALDPAELARIFDRLLDVARKEDEWGVPDILEALIVLTRASEPLGISLTGFLGQRPPTQIQPDLIPRIRDEPWAAGLLAEWKTNTNIANPVKAAIQVGANGGNITK